MRWVCSGNPLAGIPVWKQRRPSGISPGSVSFAITKMIVREREREREREQCKTLISTIDHP